MIKAGWVVITGSYFVTLLIASWTYTGITNLPIDQHRDVSGLVLGSVMVFVPYLIGGVFVGRSKEGTLLPSALWVSLIPTLSEKILIFLIGAMFVVGGGDGGGNGIINWRNVMMFITADAIPYFTNQYLLTFPVSVLVCVLAALATNQR